MGSLTNFRKSKRDKIVGIDFLLKSSPSDEGTRSDGPSRIRTRDEIYGLYCTFGEKKHNGEDFMSKILNILRSAVEGLLSHAEVKRKDSFQQIYSLFFSFKLYYKEKGSRPATRPQAIREKFEEFARTMVAKLRNYEEQSRAYHEQSISGEFKTFSAFRNLFQAIEVFFIESISKPFSRKKLSFQFNSTFSLKISISDRKAFFTNFKSVSFRQNNSFDEKKTNSSGFKTKTSFFTAIRFFRTEKILKFS